MKIDKTKGMGRGTVCAIIVAAGKGSRMKADCPKQFLHIKERPILYYTLRAFEESEVDQVIVVTSKDYQGYVQEEIVERYGFKKVVSVVEGGKERYESVYKGILAAEGVEYLLVHDGARPFIRPELINRVIEEVKVKEAVIVGVKAKDTVKIASDQQCVESTPDRNYVWNIQTPQAFAYEILKNAYDMVVSTNETGVTDDAMVVEKALGLPIYITEGEYTNIKITTPDDLKLAEILIK